MEIPTYPHTQRGTMTLNWEGGLHKEATLKSPGLLPQQLHHIRETLSPSLLWEKLNPQY